MWDVQSRVRLKVGPLRGARWDDFGPDGPGALRIQAIWQALTGGEFDLCIERVLASESGNRWKLGRGQARLGRSSWLSRGGR